MAPLSVTLAQIPLVEGDRRRNLETARAAAKAASSRGSQLLLLPELWLSAYDLENAETHALRSDSAEWDDIAGLSRDYKITIAGSVLAAAETGIENRLVVVGATGETQATYAKVHLFGPMDEPDHLVAGNKLVTADLGGLVAGLAICYDLRFPEIFRNLAASGAQIILLPAQWPLQRLHHWRTLIQARSIENQVFMIACNRAGRVDKIAYAGHSMVVDPWGDVLMEAGEAPALLTVELDLDRILEARKKIPVWTDRRPDVYS